MTKNEKKSLQFSSLKNKIFRFISFNQFLLQKKKNNNNFIKKKR